MKLALACAILLAVQLLPVGRSRAVQDQKAPAPTTVIPREGCVTSECHQEVKQHTHLHGPLKVNACDSCHRLTDAEQHVFERAREGDQLCYLCHEFSLPESVFVHEPLETDGCVACHEPHGGTGPMLLRGRTYTDLCSSCHEEQLGTKQLLHGPASAGACGACHEPHTSTNRMLLSEEGQALCLRCHISTAHQLETMHVVHAPAKGDCRICHDPHATDNPALLAEDAVTLCTSCHSGIAHTVDLAPNQHAAVVTERACLNCHDPHASDYPRLLKKDTLTLCFECHDKVLERKQGGQVANIKLVLEGSDSLHGSAAEQNCVACHQIHGSEFSRLLQSDYPAGIYTPFEDSTYSMCFTCHDRNLVSLRETDTVTGFRNGTTNLHYLHVHRDQKGRSCRICHDSHAASREHHIRAEVPFGQGGWLLPINWKPSADGGSCAAACHAAYEYDRVAPVVYPDLDAAEPGRRKDDSKNDGRE